MYKVVDGISEGSFGIHVAKLAGLKENLILGTRLPIGTNARFQAFNLISASKKKVVPKTKARVKEKMISFVRKSFSIFSFMDLI